MEESKGSELPSASASEKKFQELNFRFTHQAHKDGNLELSLYDVTSQTLTDIFKVLKRLEERIFELEQRQKDEFKR